MDPSFDEELAQNVDRPWEWNARNLLTMLLVFVVSSLANACGVGGGSVLTPAFEALTGFMPSVASSLAECVITAGTLASFLTDFRRVNPRDDSNMLVDYKLVLVALPAYLVGVTGGVLLQRTCANWLQHLLLILLLALISWATVKKAWEYRQLYKIAAARAALEQQSLPGGTLDEPPGGKPSLDGPAADKDATSKLPDKAGSGALEHSSRVAAAAEVNGVPAARLPAQQQQQRHQHQQHFPSPSDSRSPAPAPAATAAVHAAALAGSRHAGGARGLSLRPRRLKKLESQITLRWLASPQGARRWVSYWPRQLPGGLLGLTAATWAAFGVMGVFGALSVLCSATFWGLLAAQAALGSAVVAYTMAVIIYGKGTALRRALCCALGGGPAEQQGGSQEDPSAPGSDLEGGAAAKGSDKGDAGLESTAEPARQLQHGPGGYGSAAAVGKAPGPATGAAAAAAATTATTAADGTAALLEGAGDSSGWTPWNHTLVCGTSVVVGVAAALLGNSGGSIFGPLLLSLRLLPDVTAGTASVILFFGASFSVMVQSAGGLNNWRFAAILSGTGFVGSLLGVTLIRGYVRRSGRQYLLVYIMALLVVGGLLIAVIYGGIQMHQDFESGQTQFYPLCSDNP